MPHGKHGALRMFSSRFLWGKHGGQGKLEKRSWEANLSAPWLPPPPPPNSSLPKPLPSYVLMTHGLVGEAGRVSLPCWKEELPCASNHLETHLPQITKGGLCRGRWRDGPEKWTGEPALGRAAGWGQGNRTLRSLVDCITPGKRLGLLSYSLLGERVWGTAVGLLCGMETYPAWKDLETGISWGQILNGLPAWAKLTPCSEATGHPASLYYFNNRKNVLGIPGKTSPPGAGPKF